MIDLETLIGFEAEAVAVTVRGRELTLRPLTAAEAAAIDKALPEPRPPLAPPRGKGTAAKSVPDREDPAWIDAVEVVLAMRAAAGVAVMMDATIGGAPFDPAAPPAAAADWARGAAAKIFAWLSVHEIRTLRDLVRDANAPGLAGEVGSGKGGSGSGAAEGEEG